MKKVLLTAMALLTIASASAFGMYGRGDSWINFLVHGNQFRARMDQLGFVLGNGTIKGTVGFRAEGVNWGNILSGNTGDVKLDSTISAGIGYTSEAFGIGLGYNYTFANDSINGGYIGVHTPVLMINALNNNLRISIPIQVAVKDYDYSSAKETYTGVAFDNIQLRYFTGIDAFNAIRLYFYYRNSSVKENDSDLSEVSETFGFQARFYFLNTQIGNVTVNPYLKVAYNTALQGSHVGDYTAETFASPIVNNGTTKFKQSDMYEANAYNVTAAAVLGITANSDIVTLYVEPSLGYTASYEGKLKGALVDPKVNHKLVWGAYTELYITPVKDLEWYFEMDINNSNSKRNSVPVNFATSTGITWYLPALN
ncbi:cell surface protein [Brachyspira hyodysenteriae]|uniref:cell surface protein n=1 Tax=Brachyspira hyodysenteriae TaxID=159 RepID=UPI00063DA97A|nr:cell surface protein [Brachyspira hyodysenteriae]KLI50788.1 cell surface protein [Brachyspira hyodysenteriae]